MEAGSTKEWDYDLDTLFIFTRRNSRFWIGGLGPALADVLECPSNYGDAHEKMKSEDYSI